MEKRGKSVTCPILQGEGKFFLPTSLLEKLVQISVEISFPSSTLSDSESKDLIPNSEFDNLFSHLYFQATDRAEMITIREYCSATYQHVFVGNKSIFDYRS